MRHRFGFTAAIVLIFWGCATPAMKNAIDADARLAVADLVADYQSGQADVFLDRFDRNNFPNSESFRERVRDFLLRNHELNIDAIVDTVLTDDDEIAVQLHWNRSFVDNLGAHKLDSGQCEILLRKRSSGGLAVIAIHGNSPF